MDERYTGPIAIGKVTTEKRVLARQLKRDMTEAEKELWAHIRNNRLFGIPFRRQTAIRGFIVDFYCPRYRKAIEADGGVHRHQTEYDRERTEILGQLGITVLRFSNEEILTKIGAVLKAICNSCGIDLSDEQWRSLDSI